MSYHTMPTSETEWKKVCPVCDHRAYVHVRTKPGEEEPAGYSDQFYHCHYAVPVKGKADSFTFCGCTLKPEDMTRAGNVRLIRANAQPWKPVPHAIKLGRP